jgi:hypothetical protein
MNILRVGSINMDIVNRVVKHPLPGETIKGSGTMYSPGGKGANQAVAASLTKFQNVIAVLSPFILKSKISSAHPSRKKLPGINDSRETMLNNYIALIFY